MNERIKQLSDQAGMVKILEEHASEYGNGTVENTPYPELEKFAELIVKECIRQVDLDNGYGNNEWDRALTFVSKHLKEHFGVEEQPVCKHDWYSAKNPVVLNGSVCVICGAIDAREPEELKNERTN